MKIQCGLVNSLLAFRGGKQTEPMVEKVLSPEQVKMTSRNSPTKKLKRWL